MNRIPKQGWHRDHTAAARMRAFLGRYTETQAVKWFGLSRMTIARAAAGMPLQAATLCVVLDGLRRSDEAAEHE